MGKFSYRLRHFLVATLLFLLGFTMTISLVFSSYISTRAHAVGAGMNTPYGGMVLFSYYCVCTENWWTIVGPPSGPLMLVYGNTSQYENYMLPMMGVWSLGFYEQSGECEIYVYPSECVELNSDGKYTKTVGTSF